MIIFGTSIPHVVTLKTPNIVIVECAASMGIDVNINILNDDDAKKEIIEEISSMALEDIDMNEMATFVNHKVAWKKNSLITAYENLIKYINIKIEDIPLYFEYGEPNSDNPLLLPARVLYKIGILHGLEFDSYTTTEEMYNLIMRHRAGLLIKNVNIQEIINFMKRFQERNSEVQILDKSSDKDFEEIYKNFDNKIFLRNNIICKNFEESIVMAILRFNIDISHSKNPNVEYNVMKILKKDYEPVDEIMNYNYLKNKDMYSIDIVFNPKIPESLYENIDRLAEDFGMTKNYEDGSYTYMETVYLTPTWYMGWYPCLEEKESSINLEKYNDYENVLVLATVPELFDHKSKCFFENIDTLIEHFKTNGLVNPNIDNIDKIMKPLNENEINRLLFLCQNNEKMIKVIENLSIKQNSLKNKLLKFLANYKELQEEGQLYVKKTFFKLFQASMYMRGWDGVSDYPVRDTQINDIQLAEEKSCQTIFELYQMIDGLKLYNFKDNVLSIPLVRYYDGLYEPSRSNYDGYLLGERLFLLVHGNTSNNERSCMRESSNWFLATCNMILRSIDKDGEFDPGIDIKKFKWIS